MGSSRARGASEIAPREPSLARRSMLVVAGVLLALAIAEAALQVAAWIAWRNARSAAVPSGRVVLCVGDSFTYGLGSGDPERASYPAQLQRILDAAAPGTFGVANASKPGRTSRDVAELLRAQLDAFRPEFVCVLVGLNDVWREQSPLETMPSGDGAIDPFPWRWRTLRLFDVLLSPPRAPDDHAAPPDSRLVVGTWHLDSERLEFRDDGRIDTSLGSAQWRSDSGEVVLTASREDRRYRMTVEGDVMRLASERDSSVLVLERGEPEAETSLADAERWFRDTPSRKTARILLRAAERAGTIDPAIRACMFLFVHSAGDASAVAYTDRAFEDPARRIAVSSRFEAAIDALGDDADGKAVLLRLASHLHPPEDRDGRLRLILRGFIIDRAVNETLPALRAGIDSCPDERVLATMAELHAPADAILAMKELLERAHDQPARSEETLARHLAMIVRAIRAAGATPFLLSYPEPQSLPDAARDRVARDLGVRVIDVRPVFDRLSKSMPRAALFVRDGHASAGGYRVIAEQVAPAIIEAAGR